MTVAGRLRRDGRHGVGGFKLHQFVSQTQTLYATLEERDKRQFSLDGQVQAEDGKLFFPIRFCRQCGQDYYHVLKEDAMFLPHPVGVDPAAENARAGYLMLSLPDSDWSFDQLPEDWLEPNGRVRREWRDRVPQPHWVRPDGSYVTAEDPQRQKVWWQPEPFSLCLACGESYGARELEFAKLAFLSTEGRSSATTVIACSLLRHAKSTEGVHGKLLSFTDNRQDASLQAGHVNDFVQMSVLRASLYSALKKHQELSFDDIADKVVKASGLTIADIAKNPGLYPETSAAREVWGTCTALMEYRLYQDLRRGWRFAHPNLEQVGLLRIAYHGLEELGQSRELAKIHYWFAQESLESKLTVLQAVLDQFRGNMAISVRVLTEDYQRKLRRRAEQHLNEF